MVKERASYFVLIITGIRALFGGIFVLCWTLFLSISIILSSSLGLLSVSDWIVFLWGRVSVWIFNIHLNVEGLENVPRDRGVLYLFNHQSHFDILAIHGSHLSRMRFGAKIELFKFPFFGRAMRACGVLPIARENRDEVLRVYRDAEKKFSKGWNFVLAPEGTRQKRPEIGRFKKGPFLFAIAAQAPIVPIVIKGADRILSSGHIWIGMGALVEHHRNAFFAAHRNPWLNHCRSFDSDRSRARGFCSNLRRDAFG